MRLITSSLFTVIITCMNLLYTQSIEQNIGRLTNKNYQIWTWDQTEGKIGTEICENVLVYTFFDDPHIGIMQECDGKKKTREIKFRWDIEKQNEYIYIIKDIFIYTV